MRARTIVGAVGLLAPLGIAIYLLAQIPWEFGVGGIVTLLAIFFALAHDTYGAFERRPRRPPNEPPRSS